jgi:hypothetical protein
MTHDPAGNILVTGSTPQKPFVTIKYNRLSGAVMWGPVFHTTSPSGAYAVRTDAAGDVFVLGWDGQLVLVKYNGTTGSVAWGPVHVSNVFPFQLEISPSGDAFVAGELPSVLGDDSTLLKFSGATGAVSWGPITFDGGPGRDDFPAALRATAAGDVVVSVTSFGFSTTECMTLKYAGSNGAVLWGPAVLPAARVGDLALDGAGNVILVGETREVDPAMVTIKYNGATGTAIWGPRLAQGSGFYVDGANAVAVSGTGDVFVTGHMYSPAGDYDFATLKYDGATGDLLWGPVLFDGSGAQDDLAYAIALDASGNPVVAGESDGPAMDSDLVILKYDGATGSPLWSPRRVRGFDEDDLPLQNLSVRGTSAVIAGTVDDGFLTLALDEVFGIDNLPEEIPPAYCGLAYALTLAARNASGPVVWSVLSGNLPPGLLLSPSTGLISGTPSALGVFSFRVRATDGVGTSERDFTIHVSDGSAIVPILTTADPLCLGQSATLSVSGSYSSYLWLPGGQASSSIAVTPLETTDYGVLLSNGSGCRVRGHRRVFVGALPVSISAPETVAPSSPGHPASVADFGPGATYAWSVLNGSITAGAGTRAVIFSSGASGFATLQVTVTTPAGCSRTVSYSVPIVLLGYYTITPCRVFDTRDVPPSAIAAGSTRTFPVAGRCGIPADARAVTANVTVTEPDGNGHLRLFPAGTVVPPTSTINYRAGQTRANGQILVLGSGGDVAVDSGQLSGTVHLLLDVTGYFQ